MSRSFALHVDFPFFFFWVRSSAAAALSYKSKMGLYSSAYYVGCGLFHHISSGQGGRAGKWAYSSTVCEAQPSSKLLEKRRPHFEQYDIDTLCVVPEKLILSSRLLNWPVPHAVTTGSPRRVRPEPERHINKVFVLVFSPTPFFFSRCLQHLHACSLCSAWAFPGRPGMHVLLVLAFRTSGGPSSSKAKSYRPLLKAYSMDLSGISRLPCLALVRPRIGAFGRGTCTCFSHHCIVLIAANTCAPVRRP
jgi:hypothetical protein